MADDHICPICDRSFGSSDALRSHRQAKGHYDTSEPPFWRRHWKALAMGLAGAATLGWLTFSDQGPRYPTTQSHWHADYVIEICGEELPPEPRSPGGVHTHGNGRIHIHPATPQESGANAHLGEFFQSIGGTLEDSLLHVPGGDTYRTGVETCGEDPGRVAVYVDGERIDDPAAYVPMDGQNVRIAFETPGGSATASEGP